MTTSLLTIGRGKYVSGGLGMLFGPILVFGLVLLMNRYLGEFERAAPEKSTAMEITKLEKPQPVKKVERPKPKTPPRQARVAPPLSGLDSSLSGIDMGLLGLGIGDMSAVDESLLGKTGASVMTEDSVDTPPQPRSRSRFVYPKSAKKRGIEGYVVLSILIDLNGSVDKVQVLESSPTGVFDDAAIAGIKHWQFSPALYQGAPVKVWAKQRIRFGLE
ncbi:TonB family protein [Nitrosomonas sp. ANs5]|uniref:energy transducer TonB n=1 Tax=Nitrosomonas sp. ANs5 TaxID=3423941 RepID=UPI003D3487DA